MSSQLFKTTSLMLALAIVFNTQTVSAQNVNRKPKEKANQHQEKGGGDAGGGNTTKYESVDMSFDNIKDAIKLAQNSLPRLFRAIQITPMNFSDKKGYTLSNEKSEEVYNSLESIYVNDKVFSKLPTLRFLPQQIPCVDKNGPSEASVYQLQASDVCISYGMLRDKYYKPKFKRENFYLEVLALMAHEVLHKADVSSEEIADIIQRGIVKTYVQSEKLNLMDQYPFNIAYMDNDGFTEFILKKEVESVLELVQEVREEAKLEIVCQALNEIETEIDYVLTRLSDPSGTYFAQMKKSGVDSLFTLYILASVSQSFCKTQDVINRAVKKEERWATYIQAIQVGQTVSLKALRESNDVIDVQVRRVPYGNKHELNKQVEVMQGLITTAFKGVVR